MWPARGISMRWPGEGPPALQRRQRPAMPPCTVQCPGHPRIITHPPSRPPAGDARFLDALPRTAAASGGSCAGQPMTGSRPHCATSPPRPILLLPPVPERPRVIHLGLLLVHSVFLSRPRLSHLAQQPALPASLAAEDCRLVAPSSKHLPAILPRLFFSLAFPAFHFD